MNKVKELLVTAATHGVVDDLNNLSEAIKVNLLSLTEGYDYNFDTLKYRFVIILNPSDLSVSSDIIEINDEDAEYEDTTMGREAIEAYEEIKKGLRRSIVRAQRNSNGVLVINIFGVNGIDVKTEINLATEQIARYDAISYFTFNAISIDGYNDYDVNTDEKEYKIRRIGLSAGMYSIVKQIETLIREHVNYAR